MREDHDHAASLSDADRKPVAEYIKKTRTADTDRILDATSEAKVRRQIYDELQKQLEFIEGLPIEDELVAAFDIRDFDTSSDDIEAVEEHEVHISIKHETIAKLYRRIYTEIADAVDESGAPEGLILGVPQYMRLQTWITHLKHTSSENEFPVKWIHVVPGPMIHAINTHTSEDMVHDYIREHFVSDATATATDTDIDTDSSTDITE